MAEEKALGSINAAIEIDRSDERLEKIRQNRLSSSTVIHPLPFAKQNILGNFQLAKQLGAAASFYNVGAQMGKISFGLCG